MFQKFQVSEAFKHIIHLLDATHIIDLKENSSD